MPVYLYENTRTWGICVIVHIHTILDKEPQQQAVAAFLGELMAREHGEKAPVRACVRVCVVCVRVFLVCVCV